MIVVPGYKIIQKIYESIKTTIYRARNLANDEPVIVKVLRSPYPEPKDIAKLFHEYEIGKDLDCEHIIQSYELKKCGNSFALILEDFGGDSLENFITTQTLDLHMFLKMAISLVQGIAWLHERNIIHKDIKPQNIIINPKTGQVKISDFSIASRLTQENRTLNSYNGFEGTLAYISPEQTGRMNRAIDYRTDFYSLGVTFYQMLSGQLPFPTSDPIELVHCHIARKPLPLQQLNPQIPQAISDLVMKLMAKTAEERYQSAYGIQKDLEACLTQLQTIGSIGKLVLGQWDVSARFQVSQKLYGRENEIASLMAAFERASQGSAELILVSGYSGIGKTVLIQEIHKPVVQQRGYFISGKFDQYKQNAPYSSIIQAFSELIRQLLTESEAQISTWKQKLLEALGHQAQIIIDVIPEIELIIGPQPVVPVLDPAEAQKRFDLILGKFIGVFARKEHPLVFSLDDLQWADSVSLRLLQLLMTSANSRYLLIIGAYRNNEVNAAHPFILTLEEIQKVGTEIHSIHLAPLTLEDINQLVSDTLHQDQNQTQLLAELLLQKTSGNPFFLSQLLMSLHQEKLLEFNSSERCWEWDIEHIRSQGITDNVIELMLNKIYKLPINTQTALKLAACIGNVFDLELLAIVSEKSLSETAIDLWLALQEGLIFPLETSCQLPLFGPVQNSPVEINAIGKIHYKFLHDRVQQAAYALVSRFQDWEIHVNIGRLILMNTHNDQLDDRLFDIVNHLNLGIDYITDSQEQVRLAQLNLAAGRKAKTATAYDVALQYFKVGLLIVPGNIWQDHYDLTFALYRENSECAYLAGKFEQAKEQFDLLLSQANSILEKAEIYKLKVLLYAFENQASEAIQVGLEGLRTLGIEIPETGEQLQARIDQELEELKLRVGDRDLNELINAPAMRDPKQQAIIRLLFALGFPTYQTNKNLMTFNTLKMLNLSLQYGFAEESPDAFCNYAQTLVSVFGDYEAANQFGKFALKLNERVKNHQLNSKMNFWYGLCILPWREPLNLSFSHLNQGYQCGLETGDLVHSILSCYWIVMNHLILGNSLDQVCEEWERYSEVIRQNPVFYDPYCTIKAIALNLKGLTNGSDSLSYDGFDEQEFVQRTASLDVQDVNLHFYHQFKLQILYLLENYDAALQMAAESEKTLIPLRDTTIAPDHYFYQSLTVAALYPPTTGDEQDYWETLEWNQSRMRTWAQNCPANFLHRYYLIEAEMARLLGKELEAMDLYDQAITTAQDNGYMHHAAIANELAAKFYLERGQKKVAKTYLTEARYGYMRWGATAKVNSLDAKYPQLLIDELSKSSNNFTAIIITTTSNTTRLGSNGVFDVMSMIKASQALSSEIVLEKLVQKLLKIVMENAGAQTSCLILEKNGQLVVEAIGQAEQAEVLLCQFPVVENPDKLPLSVVNYVARTHENLVLEHAIQDNRFATDPYIVATQASSILCMPVINQRKLIGLLYLENNLTPNAFTPERLEVLQMLSSQIAISLENALLYSNLEAATHRIKQANSQLEEANHTLEQKVEERTLELKDKNVRLKQQSDNLEQTLDQLKRTQAQLIQTEKMSSLGQLVAGVAHEINNPANFIYGNLKHTNKYIYDLLKLVHLYQEYCPNVPREIEVEIERIDLDFLLQDMPKLISSMQVGAERIRQIVLSLRNFSRLDEADIKPVNIEDGIESTLLLLQHRLQKKNNFVSTIQIIREYGKLPEVECFAGQLNQVFMNILSNAIDALEESLAISLCSDANDETLTTNPAEKLSPTITIQTQQLDSDRIQICIADNGPGMTEEVRNHLFDLFFTTKPVGSGTGLGLSISYQIVVVNHGGELTCISAPRQGAKFVIEIPIHQQVN
jgi:predicted ATPase/signal transduction histidine kinase